MGLVRRHPHLLSYRFLSKETKAQGERLPSELYQALVEAKRLEPNEAQQIALPQFDRLARMLPEHQASMTSHWQKLDAWIEEREKHVRKEVESRQKIEAVFAYTKVSVIDNR
eukprot:jgi/Bigna1/129595/aug1.9_g4303